MASSCAPSVQAGLPRPHACTCRIFSQRGQNIQDSGQNWDYLEVNENYTKLKSGVQQGQETPGGKRGKITGFTDAARSRMIQRMASLKQYPSFWQDFTFSDDVMTGRTAAERAEFSSYCMKEFKRAIEKRFKIWGFWRREWEKRKSGTLKGESVPHFHVLLGGDRISERNYRSICVQLASLWVSITGTKNESALRVALNPKSYRWLTNKKMAQRYVSKYVAKRAHHMKCSDCGYVWLKEKPPKICPCCGSDKIDKDIISLGRYWGKIGKPEFAETKTVLLTNHESLMIRRLFRRMVKSPHLQKLFKCRYAGGWLLINRETVQRMLDYILDEILPIPAT
ncbi:MAG: hypothetical protein ACOZBW_02375 [Thermodesulfobacteriota bacterium]